MGKFIDRQDAGRQLAKALSMYISVPETIVLALPRGGVPVAYEVALNLHAPLDVFVVRKLGVPTHEELAMGAIASGGIKVLNTAVIESLHISEDMIDQVALKEMEELKRREMVYRGNNSLLSVEDRIVILVDDGVATGATMEAAIKALRMLGPERIIAAAPVAPLDTWTKISLMADEFVCLLKPPQFFAVGAFYQYFDQTSDEEVNELLSQAKYSH